MWPCKDGERSCRDSNALAWSIRFHPLELLRGSGTIDHANGLLTAMRIARASCRENPFLAKMLRKVPSRSIGRGLARYEPVPGSIVVFAAKEGQIALDGDASNSPFARDFRPRP
jgi:hypothetical protein